MIRVLLCRLGLHAWKFRDLTEKTEAHGKVKMRTETYAWCEHCLISPTIVNVENHTLTFDPDSCTS